ncbi:helix-turn-helix domain-containing protein [Iocasia frigidifontis]|uniref:Helix-turn-helix domain-containing protein n=2 Tax=Iocasia fonsfrigidae TaxID=2682810 RepID=A0A8A7KI49_9FIRM|nr:helix-turn-helix domain-containing protein [Iocasia fonsfrigidae]
MIMEENKKLKIDRLKTLRKKYNLTQKELAIRLRIGQSTVATVEKTGNLSDQFIYILSKEFGIREEWIKTGEGEMKKSPEEIIQEAVNKLSPEKAKKELHKFLSKMDGEDEILDPRQEKDKPEFIRILDYLKKKYYDSDRDMQGWLTVEIKNAFPEYEEDIKNKSSE